MSGQVENLTGAGRPASKETYRLVGIRADGRRETVCTGIASKEMGRTSSRAISSASA